MRNVFFFAPDFTGLGNWLMNDWLNPMWTVILIIIPLLTVVVTGVCFVIYVLKSKNEKQQEPFGETCKKIWGYALLVESALTIANFIL